MEKCNQYIETLTRGRWGPRNETGYRIKRREHGAWLFTETGVRSPAPPVSILVSWVRPKFILPTSSHHRIIATWLRPDILFHEKLSNLPQASHDESRPAPMPYRGDAATAPSKTYRGPIRKLHTQCAILIIPSCAPHRGKRQWRAASSRPRISHWKLKRRPIWFHVPALAVTN